MSKMLKIKTLKVKKMSNDVYKLRREIIDLIYEAKKLIGLPKIEVRVCDNHETVLGCAVMKSNQIWITERSVSSREVVFHEILHAVFGQIHVDDCPLMKSHRSSKCDLDDETCNRLFKSYAIKLSKV